MRAAWEHGAGCRAHTSLAMAELAAKGFKGKAEIQKENPKEKVWGVSAPSDGGGGSKEGAWPCTKLPSIILRHRLCCMGHKWPIPQRSQSLMTCRRTVPT